MRIDDRLVAAVARAGSLLALGLSFWYACAAIVPFWLFVPLWLALSWWLTRTRTRTLEERTDGIPLIPLAVVTAILLYPTVAFLHGASGGVPHWFARADEAYTLMIARSLRVAFPPPDLSWLGQPIRYHLGTAMLVDLLSRLTFLPVHTIYYGVLPVVMKIILIAATLEFTRRIAPAVSPNVRVLTPLAINGLFTIDVYNIAWHAHDLLKRGRAALELNGSMPMFELQPGVFTQPVFDSGWLAVALIVILFATWKPASWIEQAALLFATFLVKPQVFLAAGAGFGIAALLELRNRNWRPFAAGAFALIAAVIALPFESTYGSMTHMTLGCGAECVRILSRHGLGLSFELVLFVIGFHLFAFALVRRRVWSDEARGVLFVMIAALAISFSLKLVASPLLRERFLAVYTPIASHLFMPLAVYLDRIFDVAVDSAYDAFVRLLPLLAIPLLAKRKSIIAIAAIVALFNITPRLDQAKEIAPDAMAVLRAIPNGSHVILTNDLAYDDRVEKHLPLLNVWAPAASGQQFWASAFMFNFQHPDAAERLQRIDWFFSHPTAARAAGIDLVLARERTIDGWTLIARNGRYALYSRPEERR